MRNHRVAGAFLLSGLSCVAAYATQPTDSVSSDADANTAMGGNALLNLINPVGPCPISPPYSGCWNTAAGSNALVANSTGALNSAFGASALFANTSGYSNTASGSYSLFTNTTGEYNSAFGTGALASNTTGNFNTASGSYALATNTTADNNTALGYLALNLNTTGAGNAGVGANALSANTTGANNTAFGLSALLSNTTGKGNAAQGTNALFSNTTGIRNLGIGSNALYDNTTGSYNVALGFDAGYNSTGNDNIYIANEGVAGDSQVMRLGTQGTTGTVGSGIISTYIAAVYGTQITGSAVYITSSGQLGVEGSAERFKTDIHDLGHASEKLERLRPVAFKYKNDTTGTTRYGLIAEEVAKVYPELVIHGADGRVDGVRYEELAPMLLGEVQTQQATIAGQAAEIRNLKQQQQHQEIAQEAQIRALQEQLLEMRAGLSKLEASGVPAAQP